MSTSKRTSDFAVGLSVISITALLIAGTLWLKQADLGGRTRHLTARARDVGGVALGNPVVIRGVRAGRVESIALGDNDWVVLKLALDRTVDIPRDPVVLLAAASLFGEWQATVMSRDGVPADRVLRAALDEARAGSDTVAGAVLPDIAQLTAVAGRISGDVAKVAERVEIAFDDAAARELRESIRNFAQLSGDLARTVNVQSKNLDKISANVQTGLATINDAAARLSTFSSRVDSATSRGELQMIVNNSQTAAREMVTAAQQLRELTARLDRTEANLTQAVARADSIFAKANSRSGTLGLMLNDPALYQQSDSLVRELRGLVSDVKKHPKRYINMRMF
ncbi:MlaD family protein [Gemmatimonas sp.]|jgi:phospholipid/cholesterol/gamma-HCH transport system substrate-binding protein|uniref:MlaD family protein n=1 Tax=Gemmatimonas sp. TaxID=1962908 RepID=UPI0037BF0824